MGAGCQRNQAGMKVRTFSCKPLIFRGGGERGWRLNQSPMGNDLISYACIMKPPQKTQKDVILRASSW